MINFDESFPIWDVEQQQKGGADPDSGFERVNGEDGNTYARVLKNLKKVSVQDLKAYRQQARHNQWEQSDNKYIVFRIINNIYWL